MYNRYIPADTDFFPVGEEPPVPPEPVRETPDREGEGQSRRQGPLPASAGAGPLKLPGFLGGGELSGGLTSLLKKRDRGGFSSLLKSIGLENIDAGDVLLLLIILYLLVEGDDLELVIALGLVLIMGLGGEKNAE